LCCHSCLFPVLFCCRNGSLEPLFLSQTLFVGLFSSNAFLLSFLFSDEVLLRLLLRYSLLVHLLLSDTLLLGLFFCGAFLLSLLLRCSLLLRLILSDAFLLHLLLRYTLLFNTLLLGTFLRDTLLFCCCLLGCYFFCFRSFLFCPGFGFGCFFLNFGLCFFEFLFKPGFFLREFLFFRLLQLLRLLITLCTLCFRRQHRGCCIHIGSTYATTRYHRYSRLDFAGLYRFGCLHKRGFLLLGCFW